MNDTWTEEVSSESAELLVRAFAKLDKTALGAAVGLLLGLGVFGATIFLILKGGDPIGPRLALLGQYFVGYTVTVGGAFIGFAYGFLTGFILGYLMALLRNLFITTYTHVVRARAELSSLRDFLDRL